MNNKKQIIIATSNENKLKEIRNILWDLPVTILSLSHYPEIPPIEETGQTFSENALIKARLVYQHTGLLTLADDSGLEVDALNGAPGVYSARFAGKSRDDLANNNKLLYMLKNVLENERSARFRCVVAMVSKDFEETVEGIVQGTVIRAMRGDTGFGYDPLFIPHGFDKTFAELGEQVKNEISHRAQAFRKAKEFIGKRIKSGS